MVLLYTDDTCECGRELWGSVSHTNTGGRLKDSSGAQSAGAGRGVPELSAGRQMIPLDVDGHFVFVLQSTDSP